MLGQYLGIAKNSPALNFSFTYLARNCVVPSVQIPSLNKPRSIKERDQN
jgi:hypothetical protein